MFILPLANCLNKVSNVLKSQFNGPAAVRDRRLFYLKGELYTPSGQWVSRCNTSSLCVLWENKKELWPEMMMLFVRPDRLIGFNGDPHDLWMIIRGQMRPGLHVAIK